MGRYDFFGGCCTAIFVGLLVAVLAAAALGAIAPVR